MSRQWVAASSAVAAAVSAAILYAMPKVVPSAVGFLDAVQSRVPFLRSVPDMYAVAAVVMAAVFLCAHFYEKSLGKDYPDERSYVTLFSAVSAMAIGVLVWFGDASWNSVMRIAYLNYLAILWITFLKPSFAGLGSVGRQMSEVRGRTEEETDSRFAGFDRRSEAGHEQPVRNDRVAEREPAVGRGFSDPFFDGLSSDAPEPRRESRHENPYREPSRANGGDSDFSEQGERRPWNPEEGDRGILDKIMEDPSSLLGRLLSGQPGIGVSADVNVWLGANGNREADEGFPSWDSDGDWFADFGEDERSRDDGESADEDGDEGPESEDDWRNVIASSRILMPIERIKEEFR